MSDSIYYSVEQMAEMLQLGTDTIQKMCQNDSIPHYHAEKFGAYWRIQALDESNESEIDETDKEIIKTHKEMELAKLKRDKEAQAKKFADFEDEQKALANDKAQFQIDKDLLKTGQDKLAKDIGSFELEQKDRIERANNIIREANEAIALQREHKKLTDKTLAESLERSAKAQAILDAQTSNEKKELNEIDIYTENKAGVIEALRDGGAYLIRLGHDWNDDAIKSIGRKLSNHSIEFADKLDKTDIRIQLTKKVKEDCKLITSLLEELQDNKKYNGFSLFFNKENKKDKAVQYLCELTEWLEKVCSIEPFAENDIRQ